MRRFARSRAYVRMRAITGSLILAFGLVIVVRTLLVVRLDWRAAPALLMGVALVALGGIRLREYVWLWRHGR